MWWKENGISYPWRSLARPWDILLTEVLLRKTNAEKVGRFLAETAAVLSSPATTLLTSEQAIADLLQPFGMQRRKAAELRLLAESLVEQNNGAVPAQLLQLKSLPGVGDYIANAVMCFAFGERRGVLDTNVIRVFKRVFGATSARSRPRTDPALWRLALAMAPKRDCREYNWALLDFAKCVCTARAPRCAGCVLASLCDHVGSQTSG
jgi:A/G-specific adenine glycosylase